VIAVHEAGSFAAAVARYAALPGVVYAEPNGVARAAALAPPNDPYYTSDWAWQQIAAVAGWSAYPGSYTTSGGATIAIVDTGIDSTHPDLSDGRVLTSSGANCANASGTCVVSPALDDNGHGTHVAGIAAAATNNGKGVAGTAFDAQLIPVKVLDSTGKGSYAAVTNGIVWAAQHGARVINLSIVAGASTTLCDAVKLAVADDAVVAAAAGNSSSSAPNYPAACPEAIGVSATDSTDHLASFSNYGSPDVFVSAPGASIYSTYLNHGYATMSGTSMSTPFVAGLASQLLGQLPSRSPDDLAQILGQTSDKVGGGYGSDPYGTCGGCTWSSSFGYGRIDLGRALAAPDFALSASPASAEVTQGGSASYTVSVETVNGFAGDVSFSLRGGAPPGMSATFSPPDTTAPGSTTLTVTTTAAVAPGTYTLTVVGSSGSLQRTATVTLVVDSTLGQTIGELPGVPGVPGGPPTPPIGVPRGDFTISLKPSVLDVVAGTPAPFAIILTAQGTLAAAVDLTVSGLPPGAGAVLAPSSTTAPGAALLTVFTTRATTAGAYVLTVTGTSGTVVHSVTATLKVLQPALP